MKRSRLDLPHTKLEIASLRARGYSQRAIAEELHTSQPAVARMLNREDVRDLYKEACDRQLQQVQELVAKIENDPVFIEDLERVLTYNLLTLGGRLSPRRIKSDRIRLKQPI